MPADNDKRTTDENLKRYIAQTLEIRDLSSPRLQDMKSAEDYRVTLLHNFLRIGALAADNNDILARYWFPLVEKKEMLTADETASLSDFRDALINSISMENIDLPLILKESVKLLSDAEKSGDENILIRALDEMVNAASAIMFMTQRLNPVSSVSYEYRDIGLGASRRLLTYLSEDQFCALSGEAKSVVLVNARYISALFDRSDTPGDKTVNEEDLAVLKRALSFASDPFYKENAPGYNWVYHRFRTLQYISHIIIAGNERKFDARQLSYVRDCSRELSSLWEKEHQLLASYSTQDMIDLTCARAAYYAGETDVETYKKRLYDIMMRRDDTDFSFHSITIHMILPVEYICALDKAHLSGREKENLAIYYRTLIDYVQRVPKKGSFSFLLTYLSDILESFVEVPDGPDFQTICLSLIAALHPPTYVHTLSVALLTKCLTRHLIDADPQLFTGICGCETTQDVLKRSDDIIDFAYQSALCHDFGKLFVTETIMTYGRDLLEEEFDLIKCHPAIGAHFLKRHEDTAPYANIALMHHKWYDDTKGYPAEYRMTDMPEKTIIAIVTCADCLDASTDAVGRSYKTGKTMDEFIDELRDGSGTRYAPYLAPLFDDPRVKKDVFKILSTERDENYRRAYRILAAYQEDI